MNPFSGEPNKVCVCKTLFAVLILSTVCWSQSAEQATTRNALSVTVQAHFAAAQQAKQRGDYATAEREYQAVLAEAPRFAEVYMNLGLIYQLQDRTPEAMAEFRRALKIKPTLAGANFFLGVDYCTLGEGTKAIPYLKAATRGIGRTNRKCGERNLWCRGMHLDVSHV